MLLLACYLLGSLPFGIWVGKLFAGRDIRAGGSGHSGATNTLRQAGWVAALLVALLDLAKGYAAGWLALTYGDNQWALALAMAGVVAGHCWPLFAGFRGGMGLGAAGGLMLAVYPLGFVVGIGLAAAGSLILRHSARGNLLAGLLFGPSLWLISGDTAIALAGLAGGGLVALRAASDWRRIYRELWLDRAPSE